MRLKIILSSAIVASAPLATYAAERVHIPSDPTAKYAIVVQDIGKGESALLVISKREGSSGTSFALREVNCINRTFRYMGEGETLAKAIENVHDQDKMSSLVEGSISFHIVEAACR